ncbi:glutamyl-tRNA reductase [Deltaproteobacteria bacterium OttesenSCG-928-K17]|nr:glutamyl-tRNA reductase [Deltaproteobacteria bacterium OttesenSCG-928-K17]
MHFFITGVSHHQAPVAVREKFAGRDDIEQRLYERQGGDGPIRESLVLSTCNRLEIVAVTNRLDQGREALLDLLAEVSGLPQAEFSPYLHEFIDLDAARYLFRVAASLDSLVLGEPQILGQVKDAFRSSLDHNKSGLVLTKLMHRSFRAAKRVRSETSLAGGVVSVASAAVSLAKMLNGGSLSGRAALILGAGPMADLAAANLQKRTPAGLTIMSRTRARADELAQRHLGQSRPWTELEAALAESDLVIAATGADHPILTYELMARVTALRTAPLTIIDIGVPRNAAHDVKLLDKVVLRNIDDLNEVVWQGRQARQEAADTAELIIAEEVEKFSQWLKGLRNQPTAAALTRKAEHIRRLELSRTMSQHSFSPEQAAGLEAMTAALVRRLLHDPLAYIKANSIDDQCPSAAEGACGRNAGQGCRAGRHCLNSIRQAFKIEPETGPHFDE